MQDRHVATPYLCPPTQQEGEAGPVTTSERVSNMLLLVAAGIFFYRVWGMGAGADKHSQGRVMRLVCTRLPTYTPHLHYHSHTSADEGAAVLGSGPLFGAAAAGLERYLALVLLVACVMRVVLVRQ